MPKSPKRGKRVKFGIVLFREVDGFRACYQTFSGFGKTKGEAYYELCVALGLVIEIFKDDIRRLTALSGQRGKRK